MFLLLLLIFGATTCAFGVETCITPDGLNGSCIPINKCEPLQQRLSRKPVSRADFTFLQKSTCGFIGALPKGCCPIESTISTSDGPIKPDSFDFEAAVSNLLPTTDECGLYNPYRTFGRENPDLYEFPWIALLEYNGSRTDRRFFCGGVLISQKYVLTAANCIVIAEKRRNHLVSIRLGEYHLETDPDCVDYGFGEECALPAVNRKVEKVVIHENFNTSTPRDDIALVRLKEKVEFSDFIQPICLPVTVQEMNKTYFGKKLFVAGWGFSSGSPTSKVKLKDQILVRNSSFCSSNLNNITLTESQLCASGEEEMWCKADGGGPLMAIGTDRQRKITRWYAIGVSSFGLSRSCMADIYTKVSNYVTWIVSHLEP